MPDVTGDDTNDNLITTFVRAAEQPMYTWICFPFGKYYVANILVRCNGTHTMLFTTYNS